MENHMNTPVSDEFWSFIKLMKEKLMSEIVITKQDTTQCQILPIDSSCFSLDFNLNIKAIKV